MRAIVQQAGEQLRQLDERLAACEAQIQAHARQSPQAERLRALLGVGPITDSAVVITVPEATLFRHGRLFGAWLGLTPRQHSTGGKTRLGASSKQGDAYLRDLLVNGALSALQAALRAAPDKATRLQQRKTNPANPLGAPLAWPMPRVARTYQQPPKLRR